MIKNPLFFTIHNKNGVLLYNFKCKWPYPESRSVDREPIVYHVYNDNEPKRVQTCDNDTSLFPANPASR